MQDPITDELVIAPQHEEDRQRLRDLADAFDTTDTVFVRSDDGDVVALPESAREGQFPVFDDGNDSVLDRARARRAAESALVLRSEKAVDRMISGPAGSLRLREFRPTRADGAMLHIHGGGWMTGEPEQTEPSPQHSGHQNDRNRSVFRVLLNLRADGIPILVRHDDVSDDGVRGILSELG